MMTKWIFTALGALFLVVTGIRVAKKGHLEPASKTRLIIGGVFCLVALWLWLN